MNESELKKRKKLKNDMATKVLDDGSTWIDFRKLREIELGIAKSPTKAEQLIRTYSTGESNHSSEEGSGSDSWTASDTSDLGRRSRHQSRSRLDELDSQYGSLRPLRGERNGRSASRSGKKPMNKRSLLHSFERPTRNIDAFVSQALGIQGASASSSSQGSSDGGSCPDSGLEFDYNSLPRRIKNIQIESDYDQEADEFHLQSSSASSIDKGALDKTKRKKTKKARFKAEPQIVLSEQRINTSASTGRIRSTSLDRSRLGGTRSMSVFSMGDYSSDCRSIDGLSSEIFVHSDLNEYRGALVGGARCKPKMRLDHLRGVMTRHDDMMRVFNRRQRETIRRVEHVFESSHRQIDTVLIDMKIDMATKKR